MRAIHEVILQEQPAGFFVHESSYVDETAVVGKGTKIWHFSHVQDDALIGEGCTLGQNVNISSGAVVGNFVKIQNNVSVYGGVVLEDYVFCGPGKNRGQHWRQCHHCVRAHHRQAGHHCRRRGGNPRREGPRFNGRGTGQAHWLGLRVRKHFAQRPYL